MNNKVSEEGIAMSEMKCICGHPKHISVNGKESCGYCCNEYGLGKRTLENVCSVYAPAPMNPARITKSCSVCGKPIHQEYDCGKWIWFHDNGHDAAACPSREDFPSPSDEGPAMQDVKQELPTDLVFIGTLRRELFMSYDCKWNGYIRDITAELEIEEGVSRSAVNERIYKDAAKLMTAREVSAALHETIATLRAENERLKRVEEFVECTGRARAVLDRAQAAEAELARERELVRWRDVKQELPPEMVDVLVGCDSMPIKPMFLVGWRNSEPLWCDERGEYKSWPTHWKPMPEPPALLEPKAKLSEPADTPEKK